MQYNRYNGSILSTSKICTIFPEKRPPKPHVFSGIVQHKAITASPMTNIEAVQKVITPLYERMVNGDVTVQDEIDEYIYAEIFLRNSNVLSKLKLLGGSTVVNLLRSCKSNSLHRDLLPDLGNEIRSIIFFCGDCPSQLLNTQSPLTCAIYEALPNIKRTKQIKHKMNPVVAHNEIQNVCAMFSVMVGTLMALYPNCSKVPNFKQRCDVVEMLYKIQCKTIQEKLEIVALIPNLIKICLMEYVLWFVESYMPVELQIMKRATTTNFFLRTCPNICDMFRQEMNQSDGLQLADIEKIAMQSIERCYRLCKFKMQRHITVKHLPLHFVKHVDREAALSALLLCEADYSLKFFKLNRGKLHALQNTTQCVAAFNPGSTSPLVLKYASILHQTLRVFSLPSNIKRQQELKIQEMYKNCSDMQRAMTSFYVCISCTLVGRMVLPKLRFCFVTGGLQCNTCKNDYSVLRIEMIGAVVYFAGKSHVLCTGCGQQVFNNGTGQVLSGLCGLCIQPTIEHKRCKKKTRKLCMLCSSSAVCGTMTLLDHTKLKLVDVTLCMKHFPSVAVRKHVYDVSQLQYLSRMQK